MKRKVLKTFLSAMLLLFATSTFAVPAMRVKRVITLADGTKKTVVLCGDENVHFYLDADNNAYTLDANNHYVKRELAEIKSLWSNRVKARNKHRLERAKQLGLIENVSGLDESSPRSKSLRKAKWGADKNPISGKKKGLVILVNFQDKKFSSSHDQKFYEGYFNEVGFSKENAKGSVHDYFYESSYGQFDLTFDVIGPVTVSKNMSYYGQNMSGVDMYPASMVTEACKMADQLGVDFSQYDWDNDGLVDQVYVLYAGYGENSGGTENTIWPHESTLEDAAKFQDGAGPVAVDNVVVNTYAVSCELIGGSGTMPAGIGTACHEFAHCMCLPDMYDTNSVYFGMFAWDVMDYGSYSGEQYGDCPAPFTSYERMYCGWLTPKELSDPCAITNMKSIHDAPEAYIIYNEKNRNEYYLLENRQKQGFNRYDPSHGLLVLHVDFDEEYWENNYVNSTSLQRMTIIPADNKLTEQTLEGDLFPGTDNVRDLTDDTKPAAILNTENSDGRRFMGKPIEDITEANGMISFVFNGGMSIPAPTALPATDISDNGFTAVWSSVPEASEYEINLSYEDLEARKYDLKDMTILAEDFHGFNNGTTSNGMDNIASKIDDYTSVAGWEAKNIYTTPRDEVRIGSPRAGGYIVTPWMETKTKTVSMSFTIRSYGSDTEPVYLVIGEGDEGAPVAYFDLIKEAERYVVTVTLDTDEWWFGLSCDARCYVSEMTAYEGHITEEDMENGYIVSQLTGSQRMIVNGTSYSFSNLNPEMKYSYSVRSKSDKARSSWSNTIDVVLPSSTGVAGIEESTIPTKVFDLTGRRVADGASRGILIKDGRKIFVK